MPWCFKVHYDLRVTSIIDCFELFIEKPTSFKERTAIQSTHEHHNLTVKYLASITPALKALSKGYVGRVSDKHITNHCGYLVYLLKLVPVLADRGFKVEESMHGVQRCNIYTSIHERQTTACCWWGLINVFSFWVLETLISSSECSWLCGTQSIDYSVPDDKHIYFAG